MFKKTTSRRLRMSKDRFSPVEGMSCLLVGDSGVGISTPEACDLLNRQAETIEILRKWIIDDGGDMLRDEKEIAEDPEFCTPEDVQLAILPIKAVDG